MSPRRLAIGLAWGAGAFLAWALCRAAANGDGPISDERTTTTTTTTS